MQQLEFRRDTSGKTAVIVAVAVVLVLALVGVGYYGAQRIQELESHVTSLDQQVRAAEDRADRAEAAAEQAARHAQEAGAAATAASARAEQEVAERTAAEDARLVAQAEARIAQEQADEAARVAEAAEQEAEEARAEAERIREERAREIARLQEALGEIADTQRTALGLVMNLGEDAINFEYDKAELKPEDRELLSRIAGVLLTTGGYRIQVFGHTDDVGSDEYNQNLSRRRARAVADYLIGAGLDPSIMTVRGYGKTKPLVAETTDEARARNRRVELGIIDTQVDFTTPIEQR